METAIIPSDDPVALLPADVSPPPILTNVKELGKVVPILVVTTNCEPVSDCKNPLTPTTTTMAEQQQQQLKNEGESDTVNVVVESTITTTPATITTTTLIEQITIPTSSEQVAAKPTTTTDTTTPTTTASASLNEQKKNKKNNELIEIESDLVSLKQEKPLHDNQVEKEQSIIAIKSNESLIDSLLGEQEMSTVVCIKETMREMHTYDDSADDVEDFEIHDMPMHEHNEEEFTDTLSPLMNDNRTFLHHEEIYLHNSSDEYDNELDMDEKDNLVAALNPLAPTFMKQSDTKDSLSSIDSDISLTYDRSRRDSHGSVQTPENQRYDSHSSSDENAKDSGCDLGIRKSGGEDSTEQPPVEIPDEAMAKQISEQVEFYFSNDSLLKDAFLLKHVRRNKEGYVSLKLVSSFKRVRQLTKDWRVVGHAIKMASQTIQLNDIETKIRRVDPLPVHDETTPSRTVVATGLPVNKLTIEKVSDIFSRCGEIALVRILRPGGPIPADVRQFINKHPELQQNECALIEFTESMAARKAQNMEGLIVFELVAPKKKTGKKANVTKFIENYKYQTDSDIERSRGGESLNRFNRFRKISTGFYPKESPQVPTSPSSPPHQATQIYQPPARRISFGNNQSDSFENYHHGRRFSNTSITDAPRKFSNNSDGYSSYSDMSRRQSQCSESGTRRISNCSEVMSSRRSSNCSDMCCPCSRRMSQCSENYAPPLPPRPYTSTSNYQINDRKYSQGSDHMFDNRRRVSVDSNYDRKYSTGSVHYDGQNPTRKYSTGGFDSMRKISNTDQYYNNRKISNDSGYDRRASIGSDTNSNNISNTSYHSNITPRSRIGSLVCPHQHVHTNESVVRTPIGPDPDGNKGFITRARRFGQVIPPV